MFWHYACYKPVRKRLATKVIHLFFSECCKLILFCSILRTGIHLPRTRCLAGVDLGVKIRFAVPTSCCAISWFFYLHHSVSLREKGMNKDTSFVHLRLTYGSEYITDYSKMCFVRLELEWLWLHCAKRPCLFEYKYNNTWIR